MKKRADSMNSAVGGERLDEAGETRFQDQPREAKEPAHRESVSRPHHKNTLPLMKCARPLKTLRPCWKGWLARGRARRST